MPPLLSLLIKLMHKRTFLRYLLLAAVSGSLIHLSTLPVSADDSKAYSIFNGKDLTGWRKPSGDWMAASDVKLDPAEPKKFTIKAGEGVFVNGEKGKTQDIFTENEYGDVEAHFEFVVSKSSNSGIYFQGRYELQILDSWGVKEPKVHDCGAIYERWKDNKGYEGHAPSLNASKAPGEWQTFDVIFRAPRFDASGKKVENGRFVKVIQNGKLIQENVEVTGPTRGSAWENEAPTGPFRLQGDHGPVAFRNMWVKPAKLY